MKRIFGKGVFLGLIMAASLMGCSSGDGGDDTPPEPTYRYYAYVANRNSNNISAYTINTSSGALTEIAGSPFPIGYYYYNAIAVTPTGKFIYVPNSMTDNISALAISPRSGSMTAIAGSPFTEGLIRSPSPSTPPASSPLWRIRVRIIFPLLPLTPRRGR